MSTHLFISPHPDDAEIGCGGLIANLTHNEEYEVHVLYLTNGEAGINNTDPQEASLIRTREAALACDILGVTKFSFMYREDSTLRLSIPIAADKIKEYILENSIQYVYVTSHWETHVDHLAAYQAVIQAVELLRPYEIYPLIMEYEVWTPMPTYSSISDCTKYIALKRAAIRAHRSQDAPNDFSSAILALNHYRGIMHGPNMMYAEAYQLADL